MPRPETPPHPEDGDPPTRLPRTPTHPGDDKAMPPYTPGGVPAPPGDGRPAERPGKDRRPAPTLPPKRAP